MRRLRLIAAAAVAAAQDLRVLSDAHCVTVTAAFLGAHLIEDAHGARLGVDLRLAARDECGEACDEALAGADAVARRVGLCMFFVPKRGRPAQWSVTA